MRTRLAITSMLAIGVLFIFTGGAAMALSGSSGSGSAGTAQYGIPPSHQDGHLGPPSSNKPPPDLPPVTPIPQLSTPSGTSSLPFTGLVLIPLILLGVVMLLVGLVLRSRSTRSPNA